MRWVSLAASPIVTIICAALLAAPAGAGGAPTWQSKGPGPNTRGQVENIDEWMVVGAIHALALHPADENILYVGAVNGGIWKTSNAKAANPTWERLSDSAESSSVGALSFDPLDSTHQTLVAGIGRFSSYYGDGGALTGLLRTTDGGATWTTLDGGGLLKGVNISGVAPRGSIIMASTLEDGVYRSADTGATWTRISGEAGTGLPAGGSFDLAGDPSNPAVLYTNAGSEGLYKSADTGATWTKVSDAAIDAAIDEDPGNIEFAVGQVNNVYVAIVRPGKLKALFRSGDGGGAWVALDVPSTVEGGGVKFGIHPGGQGEIHLSIAADWANPNLVYVGGDRQPYFEEGVRGPNRWPNSVGARDYSGRLFRIDASKPQGSQASHITHSNTASNSAPHADSRDMAVAANGDLIEVDDGGVYRRTNPSANSGDWFCLNGDIQTTEFHSAVWDSNTHSIIGGAQDTGTPEQTSAAGLKWRSVSTADGAVVAVDDQSTPGRSVRYSSWQNLGRFRRRVFDAQNGLESEVFPRLNVVDGGAPLRPQFYSPIVLNSVTPTRLVIGGANSVYESFDQGDTLREIGLGIRVNDQGPIAYGAAGNADMLYVGSGASVFVRKSAAPASLVPSANYPGAGDIVGIAVNPADPNDAVAIDELNVHRTKDGGASWQTITGNLLSLKPVVLRSVVYAPSQNDLKVVVGSNTGVFAASDSAISNWSQLAAGLPKVPVLKLDYDPTDRILLAATMGGGAWTLDLQNSP